MPNVAAAIRLPQSVPYCCMKDWMPTGIVMRFSSRRKTLEIKNSLYDKRNEKKNLHECSKRRTSIYVCRLIKVLRKAIEIGTQHPRGKRQLRDCIDKDHRHEVIYHVQVAKENEERDDGQDQWEHLHNEQRLIIRAKNSRFET